MGLDIYLYLKRTSRSSSDDVSDTDDFRKVFKDEPIGVLTHEYFNVGYWRKANAIFDLFETFCAPDGIENCKYIYVGIDKLMAMLEVCKQVKEHPKEAPEILPTREGFFFGSYEYDSYYFEMIDYTIDLFEHVLEFMNLNDFNSVHYDIMFKAWW